MAKIDEDVSLSRRHLLQLASLTGVVLGAPGALLAAKKQAVAKASASSKELVDLVNALIGKGNPNDFQSKLLRVYFDSNATDTIKHYQLSKDQWEVLVAFKADANGEGGEIREKAAWEHASHGGNAAAWRKEFNRFRACWKNICDGYTVFPGCTPHIGGTNCGQPDVPCPHDAGSGDVTAMYSYPKPTLASALAYGTDKTTYVVRGEGILREAKIRVFEDKDGTIPVGNAYDATNWEGTFRCSFIYFKPTGLTPGQKYWVRVYNAIGTDVLDEPVGNDSADFEAK